jgi:hypothetical protein
MTEGYSAQDLKDLTNKALHKAVIRQSTDPNDVVCCSDPFPWISLTIKAD